MADGLEIIVKFRFQKDQAESIDRLSDLVGEAVEQVAPLFPDDDDADLGSLYELKLKSAKHAREVLKRLERRDEIEYAHEPAPRRGTR